MTDSEPPADARRDPTRRNVVLLAICQALAMSGSSLIATVASLAGSMLAEDKSLATLPVACQFLGTMATTVPASFLMQRIGRRAGFTIGQCVGLLGTAVAAYAIFHQSFWLLVGGSVLIGMHNAFWQYYRFAAADTASEAYRSRAISYVLAGGVAAAIIGPELAKLSVNFFAPVLFAGGYVAVSLLILCAITVLQFIDIPKPSRVGARNSGRPLGEIARQPKFIVAVLAAMLGYAVMNLAMTATPLAMQVCGLPFSDTAFVFEWHMLGMFAPSFFTGRLIGRFGAINVITAGIVLMFAAVAVNLSGVTVSEFWGGLLLIGLGWNLMFVGGTSLLTEVYRIEERAKVQALNDFLIFTSVAIASFSSGALQHWFGWRWVNIAIVMPMVIVLVATIWMRLVRRREASAA